MITRYLMAAGMVWASILVAPSAQAANHHTIVLTLIRHAQSTANAAGVIDTGVPSPDLTDLGRLQAQDVADLLRANQYDGIYASTMVRTQQTAAAMSAALDEPLVILPGLREIEAGTNEGLSVADAPVNEAPKVWLDGHRKVRIPGSVTGDEFEARFNQAVQSIYDSGRTNVVAFSHGEAIFYWVQMTAKNANRAFTDNLRNTARVILTGSPTAGWTLVSWDGVPVSA